MKVKLVILSVFVSAFCFLLFVYPEIDLQVSSIFAKRDGQGAYAGFFLDGHPLFSGLKILAFWGSRLLAVLFIGGWIVSLFYSRDVAGLSPRAWAFLFLCLVIGPGLVANVVLKDHWGRARPREVTYFGGTAEFTPAPLISKECERNCSFVSGDAAFGFFLPCFAYLVPPTRRRKAFWGLMGCGAVFASARLVMGAHFLSDIFYALVLVTILNAVIHTMLYGRKQTLACWKEWGL
ncbi:MAG: phosphatase PAP2 family protein [Proteobacteria bacterium]|nr:phosphatase PAP2 family protein [Pseudomonadota bacterium]